MTGDPLPIVDEVAALATEAQAAYDRVKMWPENRMRPDAVDDLGPGFTDLLTLRNVVPKLIAALVSPPTQAGGEPEPVAWQGVAPDGHVEITRVKLAAEAWIISGEWFVRPLYAAPIASKEACGDGVREALRDAVLMCETYADFVRLVPVSEIEVHPYLPDIERVIEDGRAALRALTPNPGATE